MQQIFNFLDKVELFIKGIIIGVSVSAPLGPIGMLCLQRTLNKGKFVGFVSGIGAAFADTFYAILAGFGVSLISNFLNTYQLYFRIIGGAILLFLGIHMYFTNPVNQFRKPPKKRNFVGYFASTFALTISNPITIIFFGAVFAAFATTSTNFETFLLIAGVFSGAIAWWFTIVSITNIFRNKIKLRNLYWINKITSILIILFALFAAISVFFEKL